MCLWAEAAMAVVYVQNRLSHSALGLKTPEEMFTQKEAKERREYLWDTVKYPKPSESTYLVTAILRSAGT
jgi:hypothetical protein